MPVMAVFLTDAASAVVADVIAIHTVSVAASLRKNPAPPLPAYFSPTAHLLYQLYNTPQKWEIL